MASSTGVKVSVVVPTYNAGPYLDPCLRSLLDQTLSPDEYEVIFIDDGSTDGTDRRLAALAAEHPHLRLITQPNSGGPGGPRNRGIDAARGEYIYFLDHDDWLEPDALELMHAMALRNDADIVLGKMVGHGKGVPMAVFRASRDRAHILDDHLLRMLTPHKLFRAELIRAHDLRFPEGPCRLEDHRFVLTAYFKARIISVLADSACCHWVKRDDNGNYSAQRFDPTAYFADLSAVLDIVDAHVDPGEERDRYYAHWFRSKMLRRLGGRQFLAYEPDYRESLYEAIRKLTDERFPPRIDRWLPAHLRVRAELVRADGYADLVALAEAEHGLTLAPRVEDLSVDEAGLRVRLSATMTYRDGTPVAFRQVGDRLLWELPVSPGTPVSEAARDVTGGLGDGRLEVIIRHRASRADYLLPVRAIHGAPAAGDARDSGDVRDAGGARAAGGLRDAGDLGENGENGENGLRHVRYTTEAVFDPESAREGGRVGGGVWDLLARVESCGFTVQRRLGPRRDAAAERGCVGAVARSRLLVPYWTVGDNLSVRIDPTSFPQIVSAAGPAAAVRRVNRTVGSAVELTVPLPAALPPPATPVRLCLRQPVSGRRGSRTITVRARIAAPSANGAGGTADRPRLVALIPYGGLKGLRRGTWSIEVRAGDDRDEMRERLVVDSDGATLVPAERRERPAAGAHAESLGAAAETSTSAEAVASASAGAAEPAVRTAEAAPGTAGAEGRTSAPVPSGHEGVAGPAAGAVGVWRRLRRVLTPGDGSSVPRRVRRRAAPR